MPGAGFGIVLCFYARLKFWSPSSSPCAAAQSVSFDLPRCSRSNCKLCTCNPSFRELSCCTRFKRVPVPIVLWVRHRHRLPHPLPAFFIVDTDGYPGRLDGCTAKSAQIPIHIMAHPHSSLVAKVISCTGVQTHYHWVLRVIIADPCRRCTSTITGTCSWFSFLALLALPLLYIPIVWSSTPAACVLALLLLRSTRSFAPRAPCLDQSQF